MDDETQRNGIKYDLTTRDDYLANRFTKLSSSGHDLTPMTREEVQEWLKNTKPIENRDIDNCLGYDQKGLYVSNVGGLPVFSSGSRIDYPCHKNLLYFKEPVDYEHIEIDSNSNVKCVRSKLSLGTTANMTLYDDNVTVYCIFSSYVRFIPFNETLPIESQPENVWGTEGQYIAWKR